MKLRSKMNAHLILFTIKHFKLLKTTIQGSAIQLV
jgi:hypothetical protein